MVPSLLPSSNQNSFPYQLTHVSAWRKKTWQLAGCLPLPQWLAAAVEHLIRINETRWLMAFLDGRLVSHFADGNLLAKLMMSPYEEEKDNEWARNERVNSKITVSLLHCSRIPGNPWYNTVLWCTHSYLEENLIYLGRNKFQHTLWVRCSYLLLTAVRHHSFKVHLDPPQPHEV